MNDLTLTPPETFLDKTSRHDYYVEITINTTEVEKLRTRCQALKVSVDETPWQSNNLYIVKHTFSSREDVAYENADVLAGKLIDFDIVNVKIKVRSDHPRAVVLKHDLSSYFEVIFLVTTNDRVGLYKLLQSNHIQAMVEPHSSRPDWSVITVRNHSTANSFNETYDTLTSLLFFYTKVIDRYRSLSMFVLASSNLAQENSAYRTKLRKELIAVSRDSSKKSGLVVSGDEYLLNLIKSKDTSKYEFRVSIREFVTKRRAAGMLMELGRFSDGELLRESINLRDLFLRVLPNVAEQHRPQFTGGDIDFEACSNLYIFVRIENNAQNLASEITAYVEQITTDESGHNLSSMEKVYYACIETNCYRETDICNQLAIFAKHNKLL